jgi:hypothetical protein
MTNFDDILFRNQFFKIHIDNLWGPKKKFLKKNLSTIIKKSNNQPTLVKIVNYSWQLLKHVQFVLI